MASWLYSSRTHPEAILDREGKCVNDEVFLGNFSQEVFDGLIWVTKRQGRSAYDHKGDLVADLLPVFVLANELIQEGILCINHHMRPVSKCGRFVPIVTKFRREHHQERRDTCGDEEVYLGYTTVERFKTHKWKTGRLGMHMYNNGVYVVQDCGPKNRQRPLFVSRDELYRNGIIV